MVAYSDQGSYAANLERAEVPAPSETDTTPLLPLTLIATPQRRTVEEVTAFLQITSRQLVKTLVNESQSAGYYTIQWDGRNEVGSQVASGAYIYRLVVSPEDGSTQEFVQTKRMILMK